MAQLAVPLKRFIIAGQYRASGVNIEETASGTGAVDGGTSRLVSGNLVSIGSVFLPADTYTLYAWAGVVPALGPQLTIRLRVRGSTTDVVTITSTAAPASVNSASFVVAADGFYDVWAELNNGTTVAGYIRDMFALGSSGGGGGSGTPSGAAGGDLGGTYPNPTVTDFTIAGQTAGSILYFNGTSWVPLAIGAVGTVLTPVSGAPAFQNATTVLGTGSVASSASGGSIFTNSPNVGDIGETVPITIEANGAPFDISSSSSRIFRFYPPGIASFDRTATYVTNGSDGRLTYTIALNDLTVAGRWSVQAIVVGGFGTRYSDRLTFYVET